MQSELAIEVIEKAFSTGILSKNSGQTLSPEKWLSVFISDVRSRSRNNTPKLVEPLGKGAGFIASKSGSGTWFCGSDEFLEALVLARVKKDAITIDAFLSDLYERYGIIIGPVEAGKAFLKRTFDTTSFEENARELERRLTGLGFVKRLSDDCAFVSNPYSKILET